MLVLYWLCSFNIPPISGMADLSHKQWRHSQITQSVQWVLLDGLDMSSVWRLGSGYSSHLCGPTWPGLRYTSVFLLFLKFWYSGKTFKWKAFIPYRIFSCPGQLNLGDLVNESVSQWRLDFSAECRAGGRQCDWQWQRQRHQEWFSEFSEFSEFSDTVDYSSHTAKLESWHWRLVIDNQRVTWTAFAFFAMFFWLRLKEFRINWKNNRR